MKRTMRIRILLAVLVVLAIIGGLAAASPYLINTRVVKKQISEQISDWMGLPVKVNGEPVVTVFPYLTVKLKDVQVASKLGADQPPLMSMNTLKAEMYWLPLVLGKFEVRRFSLLNPQFELVRLRDGQSSWDMTGGSLFQPDAGDGDLKLSDISLGKFQIFSGRARLRDEVLGRDELFEDVNLAFDWPSTGEEAGVEGSVTWRGEPVALSAKSAKPSDLFSGGLSPLALQISAPLAKVQIEGTAATMSDFQLEGEFTFETASLDQMLDWLGTPLTNNGTLGAASLSGRSNLVGASVAFSELSAKLGENAASGVLQLDFRRERSFIQGTLASDSLDLTPYLPQAFASDDWMNQKVSFDQMSLADIDVRLSANQIKLGKLELGRTAATLVTRAEQVSLSVGETFAYGGRLEASFDAKPSKEQPEFILAHIRAKANGLTAGSLFQDLASRDWITGTALAELDLQGEGQTVGQFGQNANGDLSVVLTDGLLNGFDLNGFQEVLEKEDLLETLMLETGETEFDVLSIRGKMADEQILIDGLRLTSGDRALVGTMAIAIPEKIFDFPGTLAIYGSADPATHSTEAPLKELPFQLMKTAQGLKITRREIDHGKGTDGAEILAPGVPKDLDRAQTGQQPDGQALSPISPAKTEAHAENPDAPTPDVSKPVSDAGTNKQQSKDLIEPGKALGEAAEEILKQTLPSESLGQSVSGQ